MRPTILYMGNLLHPLLLWLPYYVYYCEIFCHYRKNNIELFKIKWKIARNKSVALCKHYFKRRKLNRTSLYKLKKSGYKGKLLSIDILVERKGKPKGNLSNKWYFVCVYWSFGSFFMYKQIYFFLDVFDAVIFAYKMTNIWKTFSYFFDNSSFTRTTFILCY